MNFGLACLGQLQGCKIQHSSTKTTQFDFASPSSSTRDHYLLANARMSLQRCASATWCKRCLVKHFSVGIARKGLCCSCLDAFIKQDTLARVCKYITRAAVQMKWLWLNTENIQHTWKYNLVVATVSVYEPIIVDVLATGKNVFVQQNYKSSNPRENVRTTLVNVAPFVHEIKRQLAVNLHTRRPWKWGKKTLTLRVYPHHRNISSQALQDWCWQPLHSKH